MHFDIVEAIRQKQQKQPRTISIENGKVVDVSISNGTVVIGPGVPAGTEPEEEIEPPGSRALGD
ncbi:MAG TPA: hypothetical protein VFN37_08965 [Candidatus Baltobacteraceae bacterium]|nr:hypothetical protein [Candidatus Baltobacteraceae bacterium]